MAKGQKFTIRMVTDATNTLVFEGLIVAPFTYGPAFNTATDIPLSSGGYLAPVNIQGPGNNAAADGAIVCSVKVDDNYSLDHTLVAYDVTLEYGQAVIPALTAFATVIADAVTAIEKVVADTNATPQGPYAVGGGGAPSFVMTGGVTGPTGPYAPTGPTGATI